MCKRKIKKIVELAQMYFQLSEYKNTNRLRTACLLLFLNPPDAVALALRAGAFLDNFRIVMQREFRTAPQAFELYFFSHTTNPFF